MEDKKQTKSLLYKQERGDTMIIEGRFSVQSNEQDDQNFNKVLAEGIICADGSVLVDVWHGNATERICDSLDDLLQTLSNVRFVYHHDADTYSHIDPEYAKATGVDDLGDDLFTDDDGNVWRAYL